MFSFTTTHFVGELVGTMILILLGGGVCANVLLKKSKGENSGWIVISAGWGFGVAMGAYASGFIGGAAMNPAVTISALVLGDTTFLNALSSIAGQLIGAGIGAFLVYLTYLPHWKPTENADFKLSVFCTMPAIRKPKLNLITEIIGTAVLVGVGMGLADTVTQASSANLAGPITHQAISNGISPLLAGFLVFSIGLSLGGPTGYAINPARDFIPRVMHAILPIPNKRDSDWGYCWVPIVGPIVGGIIGAILYMLICHPMWGCAG